MLKKRVRTVRRVRILGEPNALQARTLKKRATMKKRSHRVNKRHANP